MEDDLDAQLEALGCTQEELPIVLNRSGADGRRRNVDVRWSVGNSLTLFNAEHHSYAPSPPVHVLAPNDPQKLHDSVLSVYEWDCPLQINKKLVAEAHGAFVALQDSARHAKDTEKRSLSGPELLASSRHFRALLLNQIEEIRAAVDGGAGMSVDDIENHTEQMLLFQRCEQIWHLCEVFYVDAKVGEAFMPQYLDWLRVERPVRLDVVDDIARWPTPETHPQFWDTFYRLILQGSTDDARDLLGLHSALPQANSSAGLRALCGVLDACPTFYRGSSVHDHSVRLSTWREQCSNLLVVYPDIKSDPQLSVAVRILMGEPDAAATVSSDWTEILAAQLLYYSPDVQRHDVAGVAEEAVRAGECEDRLTPFDHILLSVIDFDIHRAIRFCATLLGDWWFTSHLTDLLWHAGHIEAYTLDYGCSLREVFLLEYASSLMADGALWQVVTDYLSYCEVFGTKYLEAFLSRLPLDTEVKAHKIINVSDRFGLAHVATSVARVMGTRRLREGRLTAGITWFVKARDTAKLSQIADRLIDHYMENGSLADVDAIVDCLGDSVVLSDKLAFLGRYRDFHRLWQRGEYAAGAKLLVRLLTGGQCPKRFHMSLLLDALPLLEGEELVFNMNDTYALMGALEGVQFARELDGVADKGKAENANAMSDGGAEEESVTDTQIALLRLALARNLSRSILINPASVAAVTESFGGSGELTGGGGGVSVLPPSPTASAHKHSRHTAVPAQSLMLSLYEGV